MIFKKLLHDLRKYLVHGLNIIKTNKLVRYGLSFISFIYPLILVLMSWKEIQKIEEFNYSILPYILILYIISVIFQYINWMILLKHDFHTFIDDAEIFLQTLLMQRLPGGFWQWIGRINLYEESPNVSSRKTMSASMIERVSLILTGLSWHFFVNNSPIFVISLISIFILLLLWFKTYTSSKWQIITFPLIEISLYILSWFLGSIILSNIISSIAMFNSPSLIKTISVWSLTGSLGLLFFFLPGGIGIRELSLTTLLKPELNFSQSILTALILRILFLIFDLLLGISGLFIIKLISKISQKIETD